MGTCVKHKECTRSGYDGMFILCFAVFVERNVGFVVFYWDDTSIDGYCSNVGHHRTLNRPLMVVFAVGSDGREGEGGNLGARVFCGMWSTMQWVMLLWSSFELWVMVVVREVCNCCGTNENTVFVQRAR